MSMLPSNKYGKVLYKKSQFYKLELNKCLDPIEREKIRASHRMDCASHAFIINCKERREKWIEHDKKYGEFYRAKSRSLKKFNKYF